MIQQPALLGNTSAVPYETPVLSNHPVAGDQDGEVVGRDQPPDLSGMKLGCPGHVVIRASLTERDLPQGLEDGRLSGRQIEPSLEIVGVGQRSGGSGEVVIQPGCGDSAAALGYVQLRNG